MKTPTHRCIGGKTETCTAPNYCINSSEKCEYKSKLPHIAAWELKWKRALPVWAIRDSNPGPTGYEPGALTN